MRGQIIKWAARAGFFLFGVISIYGAQKFWQKGKYFVVPALILSVLGVSSFYLSTMQDPIAAFASGGAGGIRQEINIIDGYLGALSGNFATSSAIVQFDGTKYTAPSAYFEVVASTSASIATQVFLRNATSSATVATINIPAGTTAYTRLRSTEITAMASTTQELVVVVASTTGATKGVLAARIVVLDSGNTLSSTETQIEIGNQETYTSTATSTFASPKYWYYNAAGWDASPTFYAEVTYANTIPITSTTGATTTNTWSTAGTYNVTASSTYTQIAAWGGGGSGFDGTNSGGGAGGGGGGFASSTVTLTYGNTYAIVVGAGGAVSAANGASSTFATTQIRAAGGRGGFDITTGIGKGGCATGNGGCAGDVTNVGGAGGQGVGTDDGGGGGGGAGGPHGVGEVGANATATDGGAGGRGDGNVGGTSGSAGSGGNGGAGGTSVLGGGGGGGGDNTFSGGAGGAYGGGGGGGETTPWVGAAGAVTLTSVFTLTTVASTTITLQEDNGQFGSWTDKAPIVRQADFAVSTSTRVRSAAFTPTNGKHYRIVFREGFTGASHAIYNAKIVVDQVGSSDVVIDSYDIANGGFSTFLSSADLQGSSQSFTGNGGTIKQATWYLRRFGSPTGNVTAKIYNITGTFGTNSKPTGAALATSDTVDVTTISNSANTLINFTFSGANQITLTNGSNYALTIEYSGGDGSNDVSVREDVSSATHAGNSATMLGGTWTEQAATTDYIFFAYSALASPNPTLLEPQYLLANTKLANTIADSYTKNMSSTLSLLVGNNTGGSESFVGNGGTLSNVVFSLKYSTSTPAVGSLMTAKLYALTGTPGTNAKPTGAALATSGTIDASTLTASNADYNFTFSGANRVTLTNATNYEIALEYSGGNQVSVAKDNACAGPGNLGFLNAGSWSSDTACISYVLYTQNSALQSYDTSFDTADWTTTNNYLHAVSAADNSTSVVEVDDTAGPTAITGSIVTSPDNYATSTGMCLSSPYTLDSKATTNNSDIYSSSIIVQVGVASTAQCNVGPPPPPTFRSQLKVQGGTLKRSGGTLRVNGGN